MMKLYLLILLLIVSLIPGCKKENIIEPPPPPVEEDYWEFKGESNEIIRSLKLCSNGYIVAESPHRIIISKDGGETWEVSLNANTEGPIAIGPNNEIYAVGYQSVWFSYDYGNKWDSRYITYTDSIKHYLWGIYCITVDRQGLIYIGTSDGVFRSDDRGNSWNRLVNGMGAIKDIRSIFVSSANKIFAGGLDRLLFSNDNGNNWEIITIVNSHFTYILIDKNNIIYAGFADGGMYLSKDGAATWEEKSTGLAELVGIRSLMLDKNGYLFAGSDGVGIYKSKKPVY